MKSQEWLDARLAKIQVQVRYRNGSYRSYWQAKARCGWRLSYGWGESEAEACSHARERMEDRLEALTCPKPPKPPNPKRWHPC